MWRHIGKVTVLKAGKMPSVQHLSSASNSRIMVYSILLHSLSRLIHYPTLSVLNTEYVPNCVPPDLYVEIFTPLDLRM